MRAQVLDRAANIRIYFHLIHDRLTSVDNSTMVAATKGLGYMVLSASQFLQTPVVIMGIFVIAIIAFAFDLLMRFVERRLVPWKGRM